MNSKDLEQFRNLIEYVECHYHINKAIYERQDTEMTEELIEMHKEGYLMAERFMNFLKDYVARNNN